MSENLKKPLYQYMVTYTIGKRGTTPKTSKQAIQSTNPEANYALGKESLELLVDANQKQIGVEIQIVSIQGLTDPSQCWPALIVPVSNSASVESPSVPNSLEGINIGPLAGSSTDSLVSVDPDSILTDSGLPTLTAAEKYKPDQMRELATALGIDHSEMRFPQLKKTTLATLEERLTSPV